MPLNPGIILNNSRPSRPNYLQEYAAISGIKSQQEDRKRRNMLREASAGAVGPDGSIDYGKLRGTLAQGGDIEGAMEIDTSKASREKAGIDSEKSRLELGLKKLEGLTRILGGANDQESYTRALNQAQEMGLDASQLSPTFNPAEVNQIVQQGLTAHQQISTRLQREQFVETRSNNAANRAVTIRGQDAVDRRAAEANAIKARGDTVARNKTYFDEEQKMADDHRTQSKTFIDVRDAYKRVNEALKTATTSAASTLTAGTSFMKLLDPGSVVRESELGMALAASGVFDRATNYMNVLASGQVLTASQAADFKDIAKRIYKAAEESQKDLDQQYTKTAQRYGLDPDNIVGAYYANDDEVPEPKTPEERDRLPPGTVYKDPNGNLWIRK